MKKLIIAILILGLLPALAAAQAFKGEVASWKWNPTKLAWEACSDPNNPDPSVLARCYAHGGITGECNRPKWDIEVYLFAEIAQWVWFNLNGTEWHWYVKKPGNYAADCISATIKSNQNVEVDYEGFENLKYQKNPDKTYTYDPLDIPIFYCWGDFTDGPPVKSSDLWRSAAELNLDDDTLWDSRYFHYDGYKFKLWNYIHVDSCHSACMYADTAYITLKLLCQKPWIDTAGLFDETYQY